MREIKFRVRDRENEKIVVQGEFLVIAGFLAAYHFEENGDVGKFQYEEYTGLKDKNGKEVYEGDFLIDADDAEPCRHRIVWVEDGAKFEIETLVDEDGTWDTMVIDELSQQVGKYNKIDFEIIGNIYENPELLK